MFDKKQQVVAINKTSNSVVMSWGNQGNVSTGELIKSPLIFTVESINLLEKTVKLYNNLVLFKMQEDPYDPTANALARCYEPSESWWYNKLIMPLENYQSLVEYEKGVS